MIKTVSQLKDELADREAIRDCLFRYSRAVDRCDMALLRTVYWPGAMDYHSGFSGTAEEFILWAEPGLRAMAHKVHMLGNILIDLNGDKASVETYFWAVGVIPDGAARETTCAGRYLDRFERRDDEWRVAERMVLLEWFREEADTGDWSKGPFGMTGVATGAGGRDDKSYTWLGLW
jgi:hypothetical protein